MMIGSAAVAGRARSSRQTSVPSSTGRFRSRITRSGCRSPTALRAASPLVDDVDLGVAAALERVLDELGDVGFVFDHQNAGLSSQG